MWRLFLLGLVLLIPGVLAEETWPRRVLVTNDNGIDDIKLIRLAQALAKKYEVVVAAPMIDRSGSGAYLSFTRKGGLKVESRDIGDTIQAFAVDGYPADCVIWAASTIMKDDLPDLVISGINGGANLGHDWMFSGTIGAARVAALGGIPAIAVSGLKDSIPGAVDAAVNWVVALTQSELVKALKGNQFLTVSMPRKSPKEIKGVRMAKRAGITVAPMFQQTAPGEWKLTGLEELKRKPDPLEDRLLWDDGYIVIVQMVADEQDHRNPPTNARKEDFPVWAH